MQVVVFTHAPEIPRNEAFITTSNTKNRTVYYDKLMEENTTNDPDPLRDTGVA